VRVLGKVVFCTVEFGRKNGNRCGEGDELRKSLDLDVELGLHVNFAKTLRIR
jgi:hypothetical protein